MTGATLSLLKRVLTEGLLPSLVERSWVVPALSVSVFFEAWYDPN